MRSPTLLLGALLATTTTTTVLAGAPYVHSFFNKDCTGPDAGDKISFPSYECVAFDSKYDAVQVNFGTNDEEIDSVSVYWDSNCQNYAGKDVTSSMAYGTPAVCLSQNAWGKKWGSVIKSPKT